jgi:hypothetical protein
VSDATKFFALSLQDQWLLVKIGIVLTIYKGLLRLFPFSQFVNPAGKRSRLKKASSEEKRTRIVWAIRVVSSRMPLDYTCLVQALAAKWVLKRDPDVRIHIGVQKNEKQAFSAHAWVVYKDKIILGEQPNQVFKPILDWN